MVIGSLNILFRKLGSSCNDEIDNVHPLLEYLVILENSIDYLFNLSKYM